MMEDEPPATHAMVVVAYINLLPALYVFKEYSEHNKLDFSTDTMIRNLFTGIDRYKDDINKRRMTWFMLASVVNRATERADLYESLRPDVTDIWSKLANGGKHLKYLLGAQRCMEG